MYPDMHVLKYPHVHVVYGCIYYECEFLRVWTFESYVKYNRTKVEKVFAKILPVTLILIHKTFFHFKYRVIYDNTSAHLIINSGTKSNHYPVCSNRLAIANSRGLAIKFSCIEK